MMFSGLKSSNFKQNDGEWRGAPLNESCSWIIKTRRKFMIFSPDMLLKYQFQGCM